MSFTGFDETAGRCAFEIQSQRSVLFCTAAGICEEGGLALALTFTVLTEVCANGELVVSFGLLKNAILSDHLTNLDFFEGLAPGCAFAPLEIVGAEGGAGAESSTELETRCDLIQTSKLGPETEHRPRK